jgi:hypothetical protein|tara:strand:+ start:456 stop:584 length:129 start_codon:yes stop_codon:yes gene_type:complete
MIVYGIQSKGDQGKTGRGENQIEKASEKGGFCSKETLPTQRV